MCKKKRKDKKREKETAMHTILYGIFIIHNEIYSKNKTLFCLCENMFLFPSLSLSLLHSLYICVYIYLAIVPLVSSNDL